MAFNELYCNPSTGSNMNGGSSTSSALLSLTGGDWDGTSIYTKTGAVSGSLVGHYAHIFADGASTQSFISKVVSQTANTITLSTTDRIKATPQSSGTGNRSINVGGVWKGPNGTDPWPMGTVGNTGTSSNNPLRVNFKNNATYSMTSGISQSATSAFFQGYTTTPGDGGKATIDGGNSGASYNLFSPSGAGCVFADLIFYRNGSTGTAALVSFTGWDTLFFRCVFANAKGTGFTSSPSSAGLFLVECEAYANGIDGFVNAAGTYGTVYLRCNAHDNTGRGWALRRADAMINCISDTNGTKGAETFTSMCLISGCEFYNNTSDGIYKTFSSTSSPFTFIENTNFIKNGGYGINMTSSACISGMAVNCGYGAGTQVNTSGDSQLLGIDETGKVTYASNVTPWNDPANGDFSITLAAAKNAGRLVFQGTQGYSGSTTGYAAIGAAGQQSGGGSTYYVLPNKLNGVG